MPDEAKETRTAMEPTAREFIGAGLLALVLVVCIVLIVVAALPA
jgi:hypothetical protein